MQHYGKLSQQKMSKIFQVFQRLFSANLQLERGIFVEQIVNLASRKHSNTKRLIYIFISANILLYDVFLFKHK